MIDHAEDAFTAALIRIRTAALTVPEHELVGFVKGMILECPEITSQPEREALFQLVALVGSAARASAPPIHSPINVNQSVNQTVAPQQNVTQTGGGAVVSSSSPKNSSIVPIVVALIAAIGVILAAIISANSSRANRDVRKTSVDSTQPKVDSAKAIAPTPTSKQSNRK